MKKTNQLLLAITLVVLLLMPAVNFSQEETYEPQGFIAVTTMHWNMDKDDFKMEEWKAIEKEYLEKVVKKNEYIQGASIYLHEFTADNTELVYVQNFASWDDMGKFDKRSQELAKAAWPDEKVRKAFLEKRYSYYSNEHSDEIYMPLPDAKLMTEAPTADMLCYVRKTHFAFPDDGTEKEFMAMRKVFIEKIIAKNEFIKAYYPYVHAWGSDRTEHMEAFFIESWADLDKMYDKIDQLLEAGWPEEELRKTEGEKWSKYFTGKHSDYMYKWVHDMYK